MCAIKAKQRKKRGRAYSGMEQERTTAQHITAKAKPTVITWVYTVKLAYPVEELSMATRSMTFSSMASISGASRTP